MEKVCKIDFYSERYCKEKSRDDDPRTAWDKDYARLIHSSAFRRLQAKTQVLGLGEGDFYRTRLTHSMEVAQIGQGITTSLLKRYSNRPDLLEFLPDDRLIGSICLAHDLGHPPFGHGGEIALHECMRDFGGFEGNGQTLRILTKLEKYNKNYGLNPTRRLMLGVLKYPASYSDFNVYMDCFKVKPPKCYFESERDNVMWALSGLSKEELVKFTQIDKSTKKTSYKTFDATIMELADDISYGIHDLEDAVSLRMITHDHLMDVFDQHASVIEDFGFKRDDVLKSLFKDNYERKRIIGNMVHRLITSVNIHSLNEFQDNVFDLNAVLPENARSFLDLMNSIVRDKVISQPNVRLLERKGQSFVKDLFSFFSDSPKLYLPEDARKNLGDDRNKNMRVVCDYIAGMTDNYATRMYEKIFIPRHGSIFDKI